MSPMVSPELVPLEADQDGVMRVGGTRVTLDTVVAAFFEGATAEEITQQYPSVRLADVYAMIGHYLRHRLEVDDYLQGQRRRANEVRATSKARFDPAGVRDRLLARRRVG